MLVAEKLRVRRTTLMHNHHVSCSDVRKSWSHLSPFSPAYTHWLLHISITAKTAIFLLLFPVVLGMSACPINLLEIDLFSFRAVFGL